MIKILVNSFLKVQLKNNNVTIKIIKLFSMINNLIHLQN